MIKCTTQRIFLWRLKILKRKYWINTKTRKVGNIMIREEVRNSFDTREGIRESLTTLASFLKVLEDREIFHQDKPNEKLNEFIIFGMFKLCEDADVKTIFNHEREEYVEEFDDVETVETFMRKNPKMRNCSFGWSLKKESEYSIAGRGFVLPNNQTVCSCCGKRFDIDEIKSDPCVYFRKKFYHTSCLQNIRHKDAYSELISALKPFEKNGLYSIEFKRYNSSVFPVFELKTPAGKCEVIYLGSKLYHFDFVCSEFKPFNFSNVAYKLTNFSPKAYVGGTVFYTRKGKREVFDLDYIYYNYKNAPNYDECDSISIEVKKNQKGILSYCIQTIMEEVT